MHNSNVHALGVSEDVKMTRVYLATPANFFGEKAESEDSVDERISEEIEM